MGLNAVSCVSTDPGQMQRYNFSCGIGVVKVFPLFLGFFQEQSLKVPLFQGCAKSAHESEAKDLRLEDVQQTIYACQFACTAPNHYPATPEQTGQVGTYEGHGLPDFLACTAIDDIISPAMASAVLLGELGELCGVLGVPMMWHGRMVAREETLG